MDSSSGPQKHPIPSQSTKSLAQGWTSLSVALLSLTTLTLVAFQVQKYMDGQTTVCKSTEVQSTFTMPAMSFCPGMKQDVIDEMSWTLWEQYANLEVLNSTMFPTDRQSADSYWEAATFSIEEVLAAVGISTIETNLQWLQVQALLLGKDACLRIRQLDTLAGKCYTLEARCPIVPGENSYVVLYFNLSMIVRNEIKLILHDPRYNLGLNDNYWPAPVSVVPIKMGEMAEVLLAKRLVKRRSGNSVEKSFECLGKMIEDAAEKLAKHLDFCFFPSFGSILEHVAAPWKTANLTYCQSYIGYQASMRRVVRPFLIGLFESGCVSSREIYDVDTRYYERPVRREAAPVFVYFGTDELTVEKEYVLMDMPSLLSAVGGFVGMLLGWSVLDMVQIWRHLFKNSNVMKCNRGQ